MRRRHFLALVGMGALAGCGSEDGGDADGGPTPSDTPASTVSSTPTVTPSATATATRAPAEFELAEYDVPDTVEIDEEFMVEITVRNTGGQVGDFEAPLYIRTPETEWQEGGTWSWLAVGSGHTKAATSASAWSFSYINRYEIRLGTFEQTATIQTVSATMAWGGEYTTPAGYRIRVEQPDVQPTYESEDYDGSIEDVEPESGGQWAFATIWVKNETGQADYSPLASEFGLLYGNKQADGDTILTDDPINRGEPFEGGELQPGVERSGWIAFQIPDDLGVDDLTMAWSEDTYEGQISARWGSEKEA